MTTPEIILAICAFAAAVSSSAMYVLLQKSERRYRQLVKKHAETSKNLAGYSILAKVPGYSWHVNVEADMVSVERTISILENEKYSATVKVYGYEDDDERDYAIRCAEELCDKLNEQI